MGMIIDQINLFALKVQTGTLKVQPLAGSFDMDEWTGEDATADLDSTFATVMGRLNTLIDSVWKWVIIGLAAVVAIWGAWIGIKIAIANKNEEKINSRDMLKNLLIGVIVIFVVAVGVPLIIKALAAWATP